jgi:hypothetical protein
MIGNSENLANGAAAGIDTRPSGLDPKNVLMAKDCAIMPV